MKVISQWRPKEIKHTLDILGILLLSDPLSVLRVGQWGHRTGDISVCYSTGEINYMDEGQIPIVTGREKGTTFLYSTESQD